MSRSFIHRGGRSAAVTLAAAGSALLISSAAAAAVFVSVVPGTLTQGTVKTSLTGGTYANEANNLGDWPLNTGSFGSTAFAISPTNADFNGNAFGGTPNTIVAFGTGGGLTLKFSAPVHDVLGQKDFGIFTAQSVNAGTGGLFSGNMEVAILVSADNVTWHTLDGQTIAAPTTYTATSFPLNAPVVAYNFGTLAHAWSYGSPGTTPATLCALTVADFTTPMPDDTLFNGAAATNAQRLALGSDASPADYAAIFGTSGGGNWFDLAASGLSDVQYLRLNGVNVPSDGGIRLDAVFANAASVPEPTLSASAGLMALLFIRRRR